MSLWHERVAQDPIPPGRFLEGAVCAGAPGTPPPCVHRRPHFEPTALVGVLRPALKHLHRTLRALLQVLRADGLDGRAGSVAVQLGVPPELIELAAVDPGYEGDPLLTRVDCLVHHGHPMVVGVDTDAPLDLPSFDALSRMFEADPIMGEFPGLVAYRGADEVVSGAIEAWQQWGGAHTAPAVAVLTAPGGATRPGLELLCRIFQARGLRCVLAPATALSSTPARVTLHGDPVDLVVRAFSFLDLLDHPAAYRAVVEAYRRRQICVVNSFQNVLLGTNALFAFLHDLEFLRGLPEAQRDMVRHHVPWTGLLTPNEKGGLSETMRALAIAHRAQLVLKPVHPGRGPVVGGWTVSQDDWEAIIEEANQHVIQRRVPQDHLPFPDARAGYALRERGVHLTPYLVRGRLSGLGCTLSEAGARDTMVPVFAVP